MTTNKTLKVDGKTIYLGEISGDGTTVYRFVLANSLRKAVELLRKEISYSRSYGVSIYRPRVIQQDKEKRK